VPLLRFDDELPHRPNRITINGTSGAGKSTLAITVSTLLDLPYVEMDALYHGPGWTPRADFVEQVAAATSGPRWVCEFQYHTVRPMLAERADLVVWLDLPTPLVLWRVARRTVIRRLLRQELWNGNREGPLRAVVTDPEHIIRWAWSTRHKAAERARDLVVSRPLLPVVRLRTPREVERWVSGPLRARS
jgi:adenylate kinase family enzyme